MKTLLIALGLATATLAPVVPAEARPGYHHHYSRHGYGRHHGYYRGYGHRYRGYYRHHGYRHYHRPHYRHHY